MARTARSRTIAAALALAWILSACSGGDGPGDAVSAEPSPAAVTTEPSQSPSPSPSAEPDGKPERPAAMDQHDAEGAAAAAEYYVSLYDYVMRTGDTTEWEAMSHRSCGFCNDAIAQADRVQSENATWSGGEIADVEVVQTYERDAATGIFPLDMTIAQTAATITASDGEVLFQGQDEMNSYRVEMGVVDDGWVVVEIAETP
jgi:hypothetical protein